MITQKELESHLWGAAEKLRGQIDASDYKQFIFPLLFFKRISDVWDEEFEKAKAESGGDLSFAAFAENHRFQVPTEAHWDKVRETTKNVGTAIQNALRTLERENPDTLNGIFGDAPWTNSQRFSDATLIGLMDHFSRVKLDNANVPHDQLGNAYEYLIRRFADDSGHTAQEFYTNRTVVHLMTQVVNLKSGESVYDPTCGSGGLLLNAVLELRNKGQEWRNVKVYGQEVNLITSGIARMNMFLHDIEEFDIVRGNTLEEPGLLEGNRLKTFDVVLANPPYSVKMWNQARFAADPFGRNKYGTPLQSNADYAFLQHIIASMGENGRAAILFPHGVLFRDAENAMRRGIVEDDLIEGVIGLGAELFYNSSMESCVVILNRKKRPERRGKIIFVNGKNEVNRNKRQSWLSEENERKLLDAWNHPEKHPDIAYTATEEDIQQQNYNLNIRLYVRTDRIERTYNVKQALTDWQQGRKDMQDATRNLFTVLEEKLHA